MKTNSADLKQLESNIARVISDGDKARAAGDLGMAGLFFRNAGALNDVLRNGKAGRLMDAWAVARSLDTACREHIPAALWEALKAEEH